MLRSFTSYHSWRYSILAAASDLAVLTNRMIARRLPCTPTRDQLQPTRDYPQLKAPMAAALLFGEGEPAQLIGLWPGVAFLKATGDAVDHLWPT